MGKREGVESGMVLVQTLKSRSFLLSAHLRAPSFFVVSHSHPVGLSKAIEVRVR